MGETCNLSTQLMFPRAPRPPVTQQQEYEFPVAFHTVSANLPELCLRALSSLPTSSSSSRSCSYRGAEGKKPFSCTAFHSWPKIYTKSLHCTVGGCFIFPPLPITLCRQWGCSSVSARRDMQASKPRSTQPLQAYGYPQEKEKTPIISSLLP